MAPRPVEVGATLPSATLRWGKDDVILYALGVGARPPKELDLVYEERGPAVLPTFALIPNWWAVKDLRSAMAVEGIPIVHAYQSLELTRPMPAEGTVTTEAVVTAVWDKGKHTYVETSSRGVDREGVLFTATSGTMILGLGGWGGERGPSSGGSAYPQHPPDVSVDDQVRVEQAAIYRLCGDRNPLHIDASRARAAGFDDVFLHGLCTLGFAARAIVSSTADGDPSRLRRISCRFASPVAVDAPLTTEIWRGETELVFRTIQSGREALAHGRALLATS